MEVRLMAQIWLKSALAAVLAFAGGTAVAQPEGPKSECLAKPARVAGGMPVAPHAARVPYVDELPQLLFPADAALQRCGTTAASKPCPTPGVYTEVLCEDSAHGLLATLLSLCENACKEGRCREAAHAARSALCVMPSSFAIKVGLTVAAEAGANGQGPGACPMAASPKVQVLHLPCCPPAPPVGIMPPCPGGVPGMCVSMPVGGPMTCPCVPPAGGPVGMAAPVPWGMPMPGTPTAERIAWPKAMPVPVPTGVWSAAATTSSAPADPQKAEIRVSATGKRVHLVTPCLDAWCNHMTSVGTSGRVVLAGEVKIRCHMPDRSMRVVADRVVVGLTDGYVEVEAASSLVPAGVFSEPFLRNMSHARCMLPVGKDKSGMIKHPVTGVGDAKPDPKCGTR
jgi:hypothetical protein